MSFLKEKNKKLYRQRNVPPDKLAEKVKREDLYVEEKNSSLGREFLKENNVRQDDFFVSLGKKKIILWGKIFLFGLLFVLGGIFLFIRYQESSFSENRLLLKTNCFEKIANGDDLNCQIIVENANRIDLEDTILRLSYSNELELKENNFGLANNQGLKFGQVSLGKFAAGEKKVFDLKFRVFGSAGAQIFLEDSFRYKLSNFGVVMEKKSQFSGFIEVSPLAVFLVSSGEVAMGEVIEFQVIIKNESEENFSGLILQANYPNGFEFLENLSNESMEGINSWNLGDLVAREQRVISFRGKLSGNPGILKKFSVSVVEKKDGNFVKKVETEKNVKIVAPRMELEQFINGKKDLLAADVNQTLEFKIIFKNNSDRPLRDLILREKIEGDLIDEKRLNLLGKGFYDIQNKEIIWKASDLKSLEVLDPGQSGQVSFLVYLNEGMTPNNNTQINQLIFYQSTIESLDINSPLGENKKVSLDRRSLKINTKVSLDLYGTREDPMFVSFGPMPMEEGIETSVVLKLKLKNSFNDLRNVSVRLTFPSRVNWKSNYRQSSGKVSFNERSNELVWQMENVSAGVGYYLPEDYLYFQIGVTPSKNDSLKELIKIVDSWQLTAEDAFTGQSIRRSFEDFTVGRLDKN